MVLMRRPERCFRVRPGRSRPCAPSWPASLEARFHLGVDMVVDEGRDVEGVADELGIDASLLHIWVKNTRTSLRFLAEIEDEDEDEEASG